MLKQEGVPAELTPVTDFQHFTTALERNSFDLILADYSLPSCNGIQALQTAQEKSPDTPVLLVSGTIGEHAALESLRCGATDYVLKNRLERLVPAIRRAVQEVNERHQRKQAEIELIRREKYFRTLTENSLDVLTILDRDGIFRYNSASIQTVLGYEPAELSGRNAFDFIHPYDLPNVLNTFERALQNPALRLNLDFRFRSHDGSWRHLESIGHNRLDDPELTGLVINSRDVTDRKRAEEGVRESEKQYRMMFEANPIPTWVSDLETGGFLEVNESAIRKYGYSREEFGRLTIQDIRPPTETERLAQYFNEFVRNHSGSGIGKAGLWKHRRKDGSLMDVEVTWSLLTYKGRRGLLSMANDVSEINKTAEALRKSEKSLASAQRIAHLGSWELDLTDTEDANRGRLQWSDETYRIFGFEPQGLSITNEIFLKRVHADDRGRIMAAVAHSVRGGEPYDLEHRIILPGGEERIVRERGELVCDEGGKPVQMRGVAMDITERKRLEEQLRQSQKMEAIGQLAGGVAHDFNNILTVIHGHASLLAAETNLPNSAARSVHQIAQAAERAAGLTRQLLAFSRRQVMQPKELDLNQVVSNMTMMLGRILGEDISLQLNYWPYPACVRADGSMMEQVLLNLAVNARDALPKGGKLAIKISVLDFHPSDLRRHPEARTGRFVCLSVADNGCGIAPENLRRVFEPFFTTKEVGKGTGLGLATVYGIAKQHQGWIEVDSEPRKGATFSVYLPACTQPEAAERKLSQDSDSRRL